MSAHEPELMRSIALDAWMEGGERRQGLRVGGERVSASHELRAAAMLLLAGEPLDEESSLLLQKAGVLRRRAPLEPDHTQLRAGLRLALEVGFTEDPSTSEPVRPSDLQYGLFLSPFQVRCLEGLRSSALEWWSSALLSEADVAEGLVDWLHGTFDRELELSSVFDLQGEGLESRLVPLLPLGAESPFPPDALLIMPPDGPAIRKPLQGWDDLEPWTVFPALDFAGATEVPEVLRDCVGMPIENQSLADGQVLNVGKGCFVVGIGQHAVWVDPQVPTVPLGSLPRPDAIVISSPDLARFPTEMMLRMPREVPVLLPKPAAAAVPNRLADLLRLLGFTQVRELAMNESHALWSGAVVCEPGSVGAQWVFDSDARTQRLLVSAPLMGSRKVDRVFAELAVDPRPALFREPWQILEPVSSWLQRRPSWDWSALEAQVKKPSEDDLVVFDAAESFSISERAAFRRFGPYSHWDARPGSVQVLLSVPGVVHT